MDTAPVPIRYAGFWRRLGAYGYDMLILQGVLVGYLLVNPTPLPTLNQWMLNTPEAQQWTRSVTLFMVFTSLLYNGLFVAGPWAATPGKRLCKLRVVRADGGKLSLPHALWRHIASGLSVLFFYVPALTIAFTREKTAPHDLIAGTRVVMN